MDAARTALRFGAKVTVLCREGRDELTAIESEYNEAVKEGVEFRWFTQALEFVGNGSGVLQSIRLSTSLEGEITENFERVFIAIGSRPANRIVSTTQGIEVDRKGYVLTQDYPYGMTTRKGVFAGGDVVHRPQTVVLAMKAAKEVSQGIAQYIDAVISLCAISKRTIIDLRRWRGYWW